jgi:hypothetical protein
MLMPKACQPPPPRPTQNAGPAERSGAERCPARSVCRQLQPTRRQLETTSLIYVSAKCLRFDSHEIPGISRNLSKEEWDRFCDKLNKIRTPFRNLEERGGLIQSPEYENEVIILFCHMLQHLHMRIISFGTRFPDAIVLRKKNGKWREENIEFELYSKGFEDHLDKFEEEECYTIVCWEDNWKSSKKGRFEIIELKKELEKIL